MIADNVTRDATVSSLADLPAILFDPDGRAIRNLSSGEVATPGFNWEEAALLAMESRSSMGKKKKLEDDVTHPKATLNRTSVDAAEPPHPSTTLRSIYRKIDVIKKRLNFVATSSSVAILDVIGKLEVSLTSIKDDGVDVVESLAPVTVGASHVDEPLITPSEASDARVFVTINFVTPTCTTGSSLLDPELQDYRVELRELGFGDDFGVREQEGSDIKFFG